ncbi:CFC_collapsed_G0019840.mRNA.1.CDS.1 [Saccharomyces cerevisiae]|nr:CFC_collapsed_G0019840.mRNA.1.CDS.1 [Saccharomyces cerevisiae]
MSSGSAGAPALSNNSTNSVAKEKSGNISGDEYLSQEEEVFDGNDIENNETKVYEESLDLDLERSNRQGLVS